MADRRRETRTRPTSPASRSRSHPATATTRRARRGRGCSTSTSAPIRTSSAPLEEIWAGRVAGEQLEHFPWAWKASNLVGVKPAQIEIDHTPRRQWFRVRDVVSVRISGPYPGDETVTCVIPGHERSGEEVIAEELKVDDGPFQFEFNGVCGYASDFDYRSS